MTEQQVDHATYIQLVAVAERVGFGVKHVVADYLRGIEQLEDIGIVIDVDLTRWEASYKDEQVNERVNLLVDRVNTLAHLNARVAHDFDTSCTAINKVRDAVRTVDKGYHTAVTQLEQRWFDDGIAIRANKEKICDVLARVNSLEGSGTSVLSKDALRVFKDTQQAVSDHTDVISETLRRLIEIEKLRDRFINDIALVCDAQGNIIKRIGLLEQHNELTMKQNADAFTDRVVLSNRIKKLEQGRVEEMMLYAKRIDELEEGSEERELQIRGIDRRAGVQNDRLGEMNAWQEGEAVIQIRALQSKAEATNTLLTDYRERIQSQDLALEAMARDITRLNGEVSTLKNKTPGVEPDLSG